MITTNNFELLFCNNQLAILVFLFILSCEIQGFGVKKFIQNYNARNGMSQNSNPGLIIHKLLS